MATTGLAHNTLLIFVLSESRNTQNRDSLSLNFQILDPSRRPDAAAGRARMEARDSKHKTARLAGARRTTEGRQTYRHDRLSVTGVGLTFSADLWQAFKAKFGQVVDLLLISN